MDQVEPAFPHVRTGYGNLLKPVAILKGPGCNGNHIEGIIIDMVKVSLEQIFSISFAAME